MTTSTSSAPSTAAPGAAPAAPAGTAPASTTPAAVDPSTLPMSARVALATERVNAARQAGPGTAPPPKPPAESGEQPGAKPEDVKARRFAAAARQEKELQERKAALEKDAAEYKAWKDQQAELAKLKDTDPAAYLEKLGLTFDALTEKVLNRKEPSEAEKLLAKERQEREALAKKVQALEQQREQERAAALKKQEEDYLREGKAALEAKKAEFSLLLAEPDYEATVYAYLESYAREHGTVLPYLEACQHLQSALEERYGRVLQTEWARAKMGAFRERAAPQATSESGHQSSSPRTITNAHAGEVRTYTPDELAKLPMRERMAIAAAGVSRRG